MTVGFRERLDRRFVALAGVADERRELRLAAQRIEKRRRLERAGTGEAGRDGPPHQFHRERQVADERGRLRPVKPAFRIAEARRAREVLERLAAFGVAAGEVS